MGPFVRTHGPGIRELDFLKKTPKGEKPEGAEKSCHRQLGVPSATSGKVVLHLKVTPTPFECVRG